MSLRPMILMIVLIGMPLLAFSVLRGTGTVAKADVPSLALQSREWTVDMLDDDPPLEPLRLWFRNGNVRLYGPCGTAEGRYRVLDGVIAVKLLHVQQRSCPPRAIKELRDVAELLQLVTDYSFGDRGALRLEAPSGRHILATS